MNPGRQALTAMERKWSPLDKDAFLARAHHALGMALQPIIEMETGLVYGFEALMRGVDKLGFDSIHAVLDAANCAGALADLDMILREKAIAKFTSMPDIDDKVLFYNLDGRVLVDTVRLQDFTQSMFDKYGMQPTAFCLEFSETYDYASAIHVAEAIKEFRRSGVRFAIDDFGQGFSELKVLYKYQPDLIKIDRFFARGIESDSRKRLFLGTVVDLAHVLGVRVVIEGIERPEEFRICRHIGCDRAQGYFISPPTQETGSLTMSYPHTRLSRSDGVRGCRGLDTLVRERIEPLPTLCEDGTVRDVFEAFRYSGDQSCFPVVDRNGEPRGLIHQNDLKEFTYSQHGRELLHNKHYHRSLHSFLRKCPIVETREAASTILDTFSHHEKADGIIVTERSRYVGFLSPLALLEIINDERLEKAREQNPLSKLPGNETIRAYVEDMARDAEADRFFCYFDFDNFKPFNDTYGFREGDRAIMLFADLMRRQLSESSYRVGHIGGDDFFVGRRGGAPEDTIASMRKLQGAFRLGVESLYAPEHRKTGCIAAHDRFGRPQSFELMTCSVAVVQVTAGLSLDTPDELLRQVARLKRIAKKSKTRFASMVFDGESAPMTKGMANGNEGSVVHMLHPATAGA